MTKYKTIFDKFKDKITDYDLPLYDEETQNSILLSLMNTACIRFKRVCKVNLSDRDDVLSEFGNDLDDEIIDIITEIMLEGWLKPALNNIENLRNCLNTKDYNQYSPANLLNAVQNTYNLCRQRAKSMINEYSFAYSDVESLKS